MTEARARPIERVPIEADDAEQKKGAKIQKGLLRRHRGVFITTPEDRVKNAFLKVFDYVYSRERSCVSVCLVHVSSTSEMSRCPDEGRPSADLLSIGPNEGSAVTISLPMVPLVSSTSGICGLIDPISDDANARTILLSIRPLEGSVSDHSSSGAIFSPKGSASGNSWPMCPPDGQPVDNTPRTATIAVETKGSTGAQSCQVCGQPAGKHREGGGCKANI